MMVIQKNKEDPNTQSADPNASLSHILEKGETVTFRKGQCGTSLKGEEWRSDCRTASQIDSSLEAWYMLIQGAATWIVDG